VLAFDKDPKRLARLVANAKRAGAGGIVKAECADFLSLDPEEDRFAKVRVLVLGFGFWVYLGAGRDCS
jgi:putative methyltransferase